MLYQLSYLSPMRFACEIAQFTRPPFRCQRADENWLRRSTTLSEFATGVYSIQMPGSERQSSWTFLIVGLGLLVAAAIAVVSLVPLAECPICCSWNFFGPFEKWDVHSQSAPCKECGGKRKVSLLNKWTHRTAEATR